MINSITNTVTKSLDGKLNLIFSAIKVVSDVMGIEVPFMDDAFIEETSKVIASHAKAFEDVGV